MHSDNVSANVSIHPTIIGLHYLVLPQTPFSIWLIEQSFIGYLIMWKLTRYKRPSCSKKRSAVQDWYFINYLVQIGK